MSVIAELKRRNVVRVAVLYGLAAWLTLQVADSRARARAAGLGDAPRRPAVDSGCSAGAELLLGL